jgi:ferredoxin
MSPGTTLITQKMGIHEWSYDSAIESDPRYQVPHAAKELALGDRRVEVELGFDRATGYKEAERCLNCDVQTVFSEALCIECDACVDVCPTDCINFLPNDREEDALRLELRVPATNTEQPLYVSENLKTGRAMVKDEDLCLHCGLCAERCPTSAWDMQKFLYQVTKATHIL